MSDPERVPLPRQATKSFQLRLGGRAVEISRDNAAAYNFYEPYAFMRHLYVNHGDGKATFVFEIDDELMMKLADHHITILTDEAPSQGDVEAYENFQSQRLAKELEDF